jgi:hypothetical protein
MSTHHSYVAATGFPKEDWVIYDVGGSRTQVSIVSYTSWHTCIWPRNRPPLDHLILPFTPQRNAWIPFFENITAIIFLAPISCFDEQLEEDPRVNRLEDSFLLWGRVCGAKLLAKTTIVLFTNKIDLLEKKLVVGPDGKGKRVKDWLTSYGDRPNTAADVTKCAYPHLPGRMHASEFLPVSSCRLAGQVQGCTVSSLA